MKTQIAIGILLLATLVACPASTPPTVPAGPVAPITPTDPGTSTTPTVDNISITSSETSDLTVAQTRQFTAQAFDAAGKVIPNQSIQFSSSNINLASVNANGLVTAVAPGSVQIIVTLQGANKTASATLTVVAAEYTTLDAFNYSFRVDQSEWFNANSFDAQNTPIFGRTYVFSSSDPKVATVSTTGLVTGVAKGTADISVVTTPGSSPVVKQTVTILEVVTANWDAQANELSGATPWDRSLIDKEFAFTCPAKPANTNPKPVVGTTFYAGDSGLCNAAVHYGRITAAKGGSFTIKWSSTRKFYSGSTYNGVTSVARTNQDGPKGPQPDIGQFEFR